MINNCLILSKRTNRVKEQDHHIETDLFTLLRAGLWNKLPSNLSATADWEQIYSAASKQKVQGIVAEGITVMGLATSIPNSIATKFITDSTYIAKMNMRVNEVQARLCRTLDDANIPYAIIKGQGIAQSYTKPEIRRSGDIDFLTREEDFEKVNELFATYTDETQYHHHADLHHALHIDGVWVENHATARSYFTRRLDRVMETERQRMFENLDFCHYHYNGQSIAIPNPEYTTIFLMGHILRHLTTEGISMKQLCDWAVYIQRNRNNIDKHKFESMLRESGISKAWKQFSVFAVEWLGVEPGFPLMYESGHSDSGIRILRAIYDVGEIQEQSKKHHISNFWLHYLHTYKVFIYKNNYLWKISKAAYFERLWDKFAELPKEFLKRSFGIGGAGFRKDRFKQ